MLQTALTVAVIVITTTNVALWAFRPLWYRFGPKLIRCMSIFTMLWVVFLPAAGGISLGFGAHDLRARRAE